ncbi:MAG: hypothetical protein HC905_22515 [Bacteroidales bacterium]|nr:hypothetical protein [Bacteroidales bacterium]
MKKGLLCLIVAFNSFILFSQSVPGTYKVTWAGNSFGGASGKWVQNRISGAGFAPDGTVYANSGWDESGRWRGMYKDGNVLPYRGDGGSKTVAQNHNYFYVSYGKTIREHEFNGDITAKTLDFWI